VSTVIKIPKATESQLLQLNTIMRLAEAPQMPTKPTVVVGQTQTVLSTLTSFAENIEPA
jgi:hypothetical protein